MNVKEYLLTSEQEKKLVAALKASISIPILDSIEDFVWESIFCYVKDIPYVDPFNHIRSKKLYDVTDEKNRIGWSAKALQWSLTPNGEFEIVIQRADVFKKAKSLGFDNLTIDSDPNIIGRALLKHWYDKVQEDAIAQNVKDKRICILLKNKACTKFSYVEEDITIYKDDELEWVWSDSSKTGLKGIRKKDGFCVYKWYHNQTQFFERFKFKDNAKIFDIPLNRMSLKQFFELISSNIQERTLFDI